MDVGKTVGRSGTLYKVREFVGRSGRLKGDWLDCMEVGETGEVKETV